MEPQNGQRGGIRLLHMAEKMLSGDVEELSQARALRLEADRKVPMSERLARMHNLCKQMSALKGAAKAR